MFFDPPFTNPDMKLMDIASAAKSLRDAIDMVPNGHEDLKPVFTDISMALLIGAQGADADTVIEILNHLRKVVQDVYSRLEVRL